MNQVAEKAKTERHHPEWTNVIHIFISPFSYSLILLELITEPLDLSGSIYPVDNPQAFRLQHERYSHGSVL